MSSTLVAAAATAVLGALYGLGWMVWTDAGLLLVALLVLERGLLERWNQPAPRTQEDTDLVALTPLRLQAIAETARSKEEDVTLQKFLASCKLISYEVLKSLMLVDVDNAKLLRKRMEDKEFRSVRREFLRNICKKLTHPLYGIGSNSPNEEEKFRGFEIVDWMSSNFSIQRSHAVEIGQALQLAGVLEPLKRLYKASTRKNVRFGDKMRHWKIQYAVIDKKWPEERKALRARRGKSMGGGDDVLGSLGGGLSSASTGSSKGVLAGDGVGSVPGEPLEIKPIAKLDDASHKRPSPLVPIRKSSNKDSSHHRTSHTRLQQQQQATTFSQSSAEMEVFSASMTSRVWTYIFAAGASSRTYEEKDTIIASGEPNDLLYRVTKGSVEVDDPTLKRPRIVREDGVFGEESATHLLGTNVSNVTVVVRRGPVTVQVVDSLTLAKLLRIEPPYSKLFWRWLASQQATRLNNLLKGDAVGASSASLSMSMASGFTLLSPGPPSSPLSRLSSTDDEQTARRLSHFFPEWRRKLSGFISKSGGGMAPDDKPLLIKKFDVRWLSSRSELFVTHRGVGVLSRTRTGLKQSIPFQNIQSVEQKTVPNRRNGFDFCMTITSVSMSRKEARSSSMASNATASSSSSSSAPRRTKKKEIVVLFQNSAELRAGFDLIDHLHKNAVQSDGERDLTGIDESLFDEFQLTSDDWSKLTERATVKSFAKGVCIITAGTQTSALLQITAGSVQMVSHGTRDRMLGALTDGDLMGDSDFVLALPHSFTYLAETECECVVMDAEQLRVLLINDPGLGGRVFRFLCSTIYGRAEIVRDTLVSEEEKDRTDGGSADAV